MENIFSANAARMRRSQLENTVADAVEKGQYESAIAYSQQILRIDQALAANSDVIEDDERSLTEADTTEILKRSWENALHSGEEAQESHRSLVAELWPVSYRRRNGGLRNG